MLTINQRGLVRTAVSSLEPITLAEAKLYLRVDSAAEDSLITDLISVAREHAEQYLKRSTIDQSWRITLADYTPNCLRLPMGPVRSITSIKLIDSDDNETTVDTSGYKLKNNQDHLELSQIYYADTIQIEYSAGYENASDIPKAIRYGMLSHLAALYDCRGEADMSMPKDVIALYSAHKEVLL